MQRRLLCEEAWHAQVQHHAIWPVQCSGHFSETYDCGHGRVGPLVCVCVVYSDDIIVHSVYLHTHLERFRVLYLTTF